jgi:hypothetical protein
MRKSFLFFMLITSAACSQKGEKPDSNIFLPGKELAEITNKKLEEVSGLAASINNPKLLWTENDSGNGAEVFLVDEKMEIRLICKLKGVANRDWEDIAVGPGPEPGKSYVYVAEIGDNLEIFQYKNIYRFEEPVLKAGQKEVTITNFDTITFQLADQKKDTEALMINPLNRNIYIISKREQPVYLYELPYPQSTKDTLTASKVMPLPLTQIVAADFSADGKEIIMKNYKNVYYWKTKDRSIEETLKERPYIVEYKKEPQGEAITFAQDGSGYYTVSEKVKSEKSYLYFYPRKK